LGSVDWKGALTMGHALKERMLSLAFLIVINGPAAPAQVSAAELYGFVRDPSANVVPGTQIRVQNLDTGLSRTVQTAEDGSYNFLGLRPGRYSVYIEASGFRPTLTKEIVLNATPRGPDTNMSMRNSHSRPDISISLRTGHFYFARRGNSQNFALFGIFGDMLSWAF
jgi:hypothetical protein